MGNQSSQETQTEKTVLSNELLVNNEIKTTNNDLELLILIIVILLAIGFAIYIFRMIYKTAKNAVVRDQILMRHA